MTRETVRNFAILSVLVLIQFSCAAKQANHASISVTEIVTGYQPGIKILMRHNATVDYPYHHIR